MFLRLGVGANAVSPWGEWLLLGSVIGTAILFCWILR
jgi:hypothetical protein